MRTLVVGKDLQTAQDTMQAAGWVKQVIDKDKPARVFIDIGGVGAGVYDRLVEMGYGETVRPVNFGSAPLEPPPRDEHGRPSGGPLNRRAEIWMKSKEWLGDLGVPGMLSSECRDGACCAAFREDLRASLPERVRGVSIYSRSDGIVSWEACLDPEAEHVEVDSSHTGMSVNLSVYRVLARVLDEEVQRWSG